MGEVEFVTLADLRQEQVAMQRQLTEMMNLLKDTAARQVQMQREMKDMTQARVQVPGEAMGRKVTGHAAKEDVGTVDDNDASEKEKDKDKDKDKETEKGKEKDKDKDKDKEKEKEKEKGKEGGGRPSMSPKSGSSIAEASTHSTFPRMSLTRTDTESSLRMFLQTPTERKAARRRAAERFEMRLKLSQAASGDSLLDLHETPSNVEVIPNHVTPTSARPLDKEASGTSPSLALPIAPRTPPPGSISRPQVAIASVDSVALPAIRRPIVPMNPLNTRNVADGDDMHLAPWSRHRRRKSCIDAMDMKEVAEEDRGVKRDGEGDVPAMKKVVSASQLATCPMRFFQPMHDFGGPEEVTLASLFRPGSSVIRSSHRIRQVLDVVILFAVVVEMMYATSTFARREGSPDTAYCVLIILFLPLFALWIALEFRTCILKGWQLIETREEIKRHYLASWFGIDVAMSIPWDLMCSLFDEPMAFRVGLLLRLPKVLLLLRVFLPSSPVSERPVWMRVVLTLALLASTGHLAASSWIYATDEEQWTSWLAYTATNESDAIDVGSLFWHQYLASLYWAVATMTSVGYGDVAGADASGRLLCIFWMSMGTLTLMFLGARLTEWMVVTNPFVLEEQDKKRRLAALMENNNIPWSVQKSALEIYPVVLETSAHVYNTIIDELPRYLQDQIRMHVKLKLIRTVQLFRDLSLACLTAVADVTVEEVYPLDSAITQYGDAGDVMYFLEHGLVEVFTYDDRGEEIWLANLKNGSFFGEMALLNDDCLRSATVRTVTNCVVYALGKSGFTLVTAAFPELKKRVAAESAARMRSLQAAKSSSFSSTSFNDTALATDGTPQPETAQIDAEYVAFDGSASANSFRPQPRAQAKDDVSSSYGDLDSFGQRTEVLAL